MRVTRVELAKAALDLLEKQPLRKVAKMLAAYLVQNGMTRELDTLLENIEAESHRRGVLQAHVASARPLEGRQLSDLARQLRRQFDAGQVSFNQTLEPELIGGLRLSAAGSELDLSVRGKLNKLTEGVN